MEDLNDLNSKQQFFCIEYLKDFNATQAAIRAGYSEKSAYSQAHDLLKKPEILNLIKSLSESSFKSIGITLNRIVSEIASIAFSDISAKKEKLKALEILLKYESIKTNQDKDKSNFNIAIEFVE